MAGEGFGTTSIGTGGAQVVGSPTYNLERYAQPILQKQKDIAAEKAAKQKRQEKIFGDLKGLSKIGSLRYAPATEKVKNTVIEAAKKAIATQDVGDLMALEKAKLDYNTVLDLAKQNDAFANNLGSQMIQGGNFWNKEKFDNYYTPVDVNNINTAEDLIKQMTLDRNDLGEVRRDKHNPIEFANKMGGIAKTFYGNEGKFTDDDLKSSIDALFKNDEQSFDTFKHYLADAEKNADLLKKFNGDATAAAKELAYNDFKNLVGVKPARSGLTINNVMPSANAAGSTPTSVYESKTKFGSDDNSFTANTVATSFPVKSAITNIPEGTFSPTTLKQYNAGEPKKITYGEFNIIPVLDQDIDLGNGEKIPAGTPIPEGASIADIVKIWVGKDRDKYRGNGVVGYYLDAPKGGGRMPKTDLGIFAVGTDDNNEPYYTPYTRVAGAIQGGLSKDDQIKFDQQFDIITDEYNRRGGRKNYSPVNQKTNKETVTYSNSKQRGRER